MSTMSNVPATYYNFLDTLVFNPGGKFITAADKEAAMNAAMLFVADRLGGLFFVDETVSTGTSGTQTSFTTPDTILGIRYLESVDQSVVPEVRSVIDVIPLEQHRFLNQDLATENPFAYFDPERHLLTIEPAPPANRILRMLYFGLPNFMAIGSTGATLSDSNIDQLYAICYEAAAILRSKTRDVEESAALHQRAMEGIEAAAQGNSVRRQVKRLQVGRHTPPTRMRRT